MTRPIRPANTTATLIPCLRYRDVRAAIAWLEKAFGFTRQAVYEDGQGGIAHVQLAFGNGMVMLGQVPKVETPYSRLTRQPDEIGGFETQAPYVVVADADAVYASAQAAGARIVIEIADADYGGRGFSCTDLEGHLWSFGTYDPWATPAAG